MGLFESALFSLIGVAGQVYVYEDRVIIAREGAFAKMSHGLKGNKTIPIGSIHSVQFKEGTALTNGFIQFGIIGGNESRGGLLAATQDENTVMFKKSMNPIAYKIKDFLENKIFEKSNVASSAGTISPADELKKYKELADSGVITQEKFESKKKQLLGL